MLTPILTSIIDGTSGSITLQGFFICIISALVLGAVFAFVYSKKSGSSKSFITTLAMLPAIVTVVIMMVSGSVGAGVAVAGAFSIIRFRSAPGTAREICAIFMVMTVGLACGMGYPFIAAIFTVIMAIIWIIYSMRDSEAKGELDRVLRVTVPEELNYTGEFDDIFRNYTTSEKLVRVKTTNLGSLNRLTYLITLKKNISEKEMIDELRCRNGNLEISVSMPEMDSLSL